MVNQSIFQGNLTVLNMYAYDNRETTKIEPRKKN